MSVSLGDGRLVGRIRAPMEAGLAVDDVGRHGGILPGRSLLLARALRRTSRPRTDTLPLAGHTRAVRIIATDACHGRGQPGHHTAFPGVREEPAGPPLGHVYLGTLSPKGQNTIS